MKSLLRLAAGILLFVLAFPVSAQVFISTGVHTSIPRILGGLVHIGVLWSGLITTALFLIGASMMVGSGGSDALLSNGKKIMTASLIGLAIILSSWLILSTVVYFIAA
jgi:hypothetical protein